MYLIRPNDWNEKVSYGDLEKSGDMPVGGGTEPVHTNTRRCIMSETPVVEVFFDYI
jgi:hypothetical protein